MGVGVQYPWDLESGRRDKVYVVDRDVLDYDNSQRDPTDLKSFRGSCLFLADGS